MPSLNWILKPDSNAFYSYKVSSFYPYSVSKNELSFLFCGRGKANISKIFKGTFSLSKNSLINIDKCLITNNNFLYDKYGCTYPLKIKNKFGNYVFYTGWRRLNGFFTNHLCCQINQKYYKKIQIPSKFGIGSFDIIKHNDCYLIFYTDFYKKKNLDYSYGISIASSKDLINWKKIKSLIIKKIANSDKICHPTIYKRNNNFFMYVSHRNKRYKIGLLKSTNLINWELINHNIFKTTHKGELSYPRYFNFKNKNYLFFTGKKYGLGGIGYAKIR